MSSSSRLGWHYFNFIVRAIAAMVWVLGQIIQYVSKLVFSVQFTAQGVQRVRCAVGVMVLRVSTWDTATAESWCWMEKAFGWRNFRCQLEVWRGSTVSLAVVSTLSLIVVLAVRSHNVSTASFTVVSTVSVTVVSIVRLNVVSQTRLTGVLKEIFTVVLTISLTVKQSN